MADALLSFPDAILVIDPKACLVWGNLAAERLFGMTLEESIGKTGFDLIHPEDHELALVCLTSVRSKEVGSPIEIRVNTAQGWRLIELIGGPSKWQGQEVILLCLRDLTERRRYELASGHENLFRSVVHNAGSVLMLVSTDGTIQTVSGAITRMLGHSIESVEGQSLLRIVTPADRDRCARSLAYAQRGATSARPAMFRVGLLRHESDHAVPFDLSVVNLVNDPTVEGLVISAQDATAQLAAESELSAALARLTATLDSTADGILVVDTDGTITDVNRRLGEIWGIPEDAVSEHDNLRSLSFVLDRVSDPDAFIAHMAELDRQPERESFDLIEFLDGRTVERYSTPQRVEGKVVGRVYSFRDVTDRKLLEDELSYWAFHDSLTRLANKSLFQDLLNHALARSVRKGSHLAVLFIDLDNFKTVNDTLGHGEGDQLLRVVARTISDQLHPTDTAARLGGDEFAILIENVTSHDVVTELAKRILDALRPAVRLGTNLVHAEGSIGIAFDAEGITSEQILRNADIAMYQAKKLGKNRYEVYRNEMHALVLARAEMEDELTAAVRAGKLVAYYQPIINLHTHKVAGFEVLVRWPHPVRGLVSPGDFIPFAQEIGLIGEIDAFMLRTACRQVREWQAVGLYDSDLDISVNLSAGQLADPGLSDRIAGMLRECAFEPESLILEITESELINDNDTAHTNLTALRGFGVRIALDDFGTGYTTLLHLDRLPVDIVKIDRYFVEKLGGDHDEQSMAAAIVQLATTLGYDIIAEGVETVGQERSLRSLGCALAQGYHLGRPLNLDATRWLLATQVEAEGELPAG
jgi:diguanylate cyclase (GGDEF)-like protein/PAS domain S-box-containing protein